MLNYQVRYLSVSNFQQVKKKDFNSEAHALLLGLLFVVFLHRGIVHPHCSVVGRLLVSRCLNEMSLLSPITGLFLYGSVIFKRTLTKGAGGGGIIATQTDGSSQQEIFSITLNWFSERSC